MKSLLKQKLKGISILEVIIVLSISGVIFIIAIGVFNSRKRTLYDDAARRVMSQIALVRNEAQQGLGPETPEGRTRLTGNEIFGQAIEFSPFSMKIYKLMQTPAQKDTLGNIVKRSYVKVYEERTELMPEGLAWFIPYSNAPACTEFTSCYSATTTETLQPMTQPPINLGQKCFGTCNWSLLLVIKNHTGATFAMTRNPFVSDVNLDDYLFEADNPENYRPDRQGVLRLAMVLPEAGVNFDQQVANSTYKYYSIFNLNISGDQHLEIE